MRQLMAGALDGVVVRILALQDEARDAGSSSPRPCWPMITLRSQKGWTGPKEVNGKKVEGFWRSHQVPIANAHGDAAHLKLLENWMKS